MTNSRKLFIDDKTNELIIQLKEKKIKLNDNVYTGSVLLAKNLLNYANELNVKLLGDVYNCYIENIIRTKNILNYKYIHPADIKLSDMALNNKNLFSKGQKFNYYNLNELKSDMSTIGSFLPIYVEKELVDNKYVLRYGCHRIAACHELIKDGLWVDKKILCWIIEDDSKLNIISSIKLLYPTILIKEYLKYLNMDAKRISLNKSEITIKNMYDVWTVLTSLKVELNSLIDIYKYNLIGAGYYPSKIINPRDKLDEIYFLH